MEENDIINFGSIINQINSELKYITPKENPTSQIKQTERVLLVAILNDCVMSFPRQTKSHRSKSDEKRTIIHGNVLSRCHIQTNKETNIQKGESYLDHLNKTIIFKKSESCDPIVFEVKIHWDTIKYLCTIKETNNSSQMLFTNDKLAEYPLFYQGSTKRHNGFITESYKLICALINGKSIVPGTFNDMFKIMCEYNTKYKPKIAISNKQYGGKQQNVKEQETSTDLTKSQWEEIFNTLGIMPKDCPCNQYGKALYKRCILEGKPQKGLRPFHKEGCTRILSLVSL